MPNPRIASLEPIHIELEPKDKGYWWCSCGYSAAQPFCDGSHNKEKECGCTPLNFNVEKKGEVWLCMCKHTGNPPYCDGMHCKLEEYKDREGK